MKQELIAYLPVLKPNCLFLGHPLQTHHRRHVFELFIRLSTV